MGEPKMPTLDDIAKKYRAKSAGLEAKTLKRELDEVTRHTNLTGKGLVEGIQEKFGQKTIEVEWMEKPSSRVPKEIEIEGVKKEINYMRDGLITFTDGTDATYERLVDTPGLPQKIRLTYTPERKTDESEKVE